MKIKHIYTTKEKQKNHNHNKLSYGHKKKINTKFSRNRTRHTLT